MVPGGAGSGGGLLAAKAVVRAMARATRTAARMVVSGRLFRWGRSGLCAGRTAAVCMLSLPPWGRNPPLGATWAPLVYPFICAPSPSARVPRCSVLEPSEPQIVSGQEFVPESDAVLAGGSLPKF